MTKQRLKPVFHEMNVPSPADAKIEVLHEQPGLCAWVGKKAEDGRILDAVPFFTAQENGQELSPFNVGIVLLVDIARDIAVENRYAAHNFAMSNADTLKNHINDTYGKETLEHILYEFVSKKIQPDSFKFIARRLVRILKVNYLDAASNIELDGTRIRMKYPPTNLSKVGHKTKITTLSELATWLGNTWLEAEFNLLRKQPQLADRSKFFEVVENESEVSDVPSTATSSEVASPASSFDDSSISTV